LPTSGGSDPGSSRSRRTLSAVSVKRICQHT
jgi:hypothetical protein